MDAHGLEALVSALYSKFILRDFAGKIVPGSILLFSLASTFASPRTVLTWVSRQGRLALAILLGLAWVLTLSTQYLGERTCLWTYFPREVVADCGGQHSEIAFMTATVTVERFLKDAPQGQKDQYERFVIIKEACGNCFMAVLLSGLCLLVGVLRGQVSPPSWGWVPLVGVTWAIALYALHGMHVEHAERQWQFARRLGMRPATHTVREAVSGAPDAADAVLRALCNRIGVDSGRH